MIFRELINASVQAKNSTEVLAEGAKLLYNGGFVKETYFHALVVRESKFPTGLILKNISVAVPHTDRVYVIKPGICVMKMMHPVPFRHMGDPNQIVKADLVLMMAILNSNEQIDTLKKTVNIFQNQLIIDEFKKAKTDVELFRVAKKYL